MRNCFVPGCDQKSKHMKKRPMFMVPKDKALFAKWLEALPKLRSLKDHDRVCSLHFLPHEIERCFQHIINGQLYQLDRDRVRLKLNVVPSQNLPTSEELLLIKQSRRNSGKRNPTNSVAVPEDMINQDVNQFEVINKADDVVPDCIDVSSIVEVNLNALEAINVSNNVEINSEDVDLNAQYIFDNLYDRVFEISLPSTLWGIHRCPQRTKIVFNCLDVTQLQSSRMLTVDKYGIVKVFVAAQEVRTLNLSEQLCTIEDFSNLLLKLDKTRVCGGLRTNNLARV